MLALAQAAIAAQSEADARTAELGRALSSMRKGFSLETSRMINVSKRINETGAENVIPVSSMVRLHRYRLVNIELSFEVSAAKSRRKTPGPPTVFGLHPGKRATKHNATIRIVTHPQVSAEFAVDGVKYGELALNPGSTR